MLLRHHRYANRISTVITVLWGLDLSGITLQNWPELLGLSRENLAVGVQLKEKGSLREAQGSGVRCIYEAWLYCSCFAASPVLVCSARTIMAKPEKNHLDPAEYLSRVY